MNDTDRAILDFESEWWRHSGTKERLVQERFGLSATRYYQRLNRLLDDPEALEQAPALVNRLLRVRDRGTARGPDEPTRSTAEDEHDDPRG
ncbi:MULTISPECIES: DUF3263 domain-containing protein [Actinopolyspora]|uniref:DUF3263 domain-containing protein n=1 Tax=Actinopolyspora saharensis TaxID=995062 RepID=A0A1H1DAQ9_9ACTN|nr:DUF3263 domain-containing protein [Actinopolyspora saharensis]NHD18551.1 DUF3263 domain-containing protein [Actinopolyspora sp. BKK2]NHE77490.1 DUF3263 domain-containing protein [Actinopolyspora sp. BKK1]SDQ73607.1 Protein of unknown function [Actinopolyspora saharensis]